MNSKSDADILVKSLNKIHEKLQNLHEEWKGVGPVKKDAREFEGKALEEKLNNAEFNLNQLMVGREAFIARLAASLEASPEDIAAE